MGCPVFLNTPDSISIELRVCRAGDPSGSSNLADDQRLEVRVPLAKLAWGLGINPHAGSKTMATVGCLQLDRTMIEWLILATSCCSAFCKSPTYRHTAILDGPYPSDPQNVVFDFNTNPVLAPEARSSDHRGHTLGQI